MLLGDFETVEAMRRDERLAEMMKRARELAGQGHRVQMIEAMLAANGFSEDAEFIEQPQIWRELKEHCRPRPTARRD